jgi:hypothetical protein
VSNQLIQSGAQGGRLSGQLPASRAQQGGQAEKQRVAWGLAAMPPTSLWAAGFGVYSTPDPNRYTTDGSAQPFQIAVCSNYSIVKAVFTVLLRYNALSVWRKQGRAPVDMFPAQF